MSDNKARQLMFKKMAAGIPISSMDDFARLAGKDSIPTKLLKMLMPKGLSNKFYNVGREAFPTVLSKVEAGIKAPLQEIAERAPTDIERAFSADPSKVYKAPATLGATIGGGVGAMVDTSEERENPILGTTKKVPGTWSDRIKSMATGAGIGALLGVGARAAKFKGSQDPLLQKILTHEKGIAGLSSNELLTAAEKHLPFEKWTDIIDDLNRSIKPGGELAQYLDTDIMSASDKKKTFEELYKKNLAPYLSGVSAENQGIINWSPTGISWLDRLTNRSRLRERYMTADVLASMPELRQHIKLQPGLGTRSTLLNRFKTKIAPKEVYTELANFGKQMAEGKLTPTEKMLLDMEDFVGVRQLEEVAAKAMDHINARIRIPRIFGRMFGPDESVVIVNQLLSDPNIGKLLLEGIHTGRLGPSTKALVQEAMSKGLRIVDR